MDDQLQDQLYRFGGGVSSSTITWGTAGLLLTAILLMFLLSRKYTILPLLSATIFIPYTQLFVIAGLHFNISRTLLPFAWIRVLASKHAEGERWLQLNGLDKAILLWVITDAICNTFLWGSLGAFINRMGSLYNVLGTYFLLRLLIREREDVRRAVRAFAVICGLLAAFMLVEQATGRNAFSVFGMVPEFTPIREGKLRSQAAFAHAIVAGTVGATLVPLFVSIWWQKTESKLLSTVGILSGIAMAVTSSSATPLLALVVGIGALLMWPLRRMMRVIRWEFVICLAILHIVMKAPVWALIGRISIIGGNSSWHRFELVNQTILHFWEWWLLGARNPSSWGWEIGDISNAFVNAATSGGLLALMSFLAIFWQAFRALGISRKRADRAGDRETELTVWTFGCALFSTAVAFLGIWYFDQSAVIWYALLAMISAITSVARSAEPGQLPTASCSESPIECLSSALTS